MSKDPLRFDSGDPPNLYLYASGDPVNFIDPTGQTTIVGPWWGPIIGGGVAGGAVGGVAGALIGACVGALFLATGDTPREDEDDCDKQWSDAYARCADIITGKQTEEAKRLRGRPNYNIDECAAGFVSEKCGGNPIDHGKQRRRR